VDLVVVIAAVHIQEVHTPTAARACGNPDHYPEEAGHLQARRQDSQAEAASRHPRSEGEDSPTVSAAVPDRRGNSRAGSLRARASSAAARRRWGLRQDDPTGWDYGRAHGHKGGCTAPEARDLTGRRRVA
jgi:hypothetical protein